MMLETLTEAAAENLHHTYFELGRAAARSRIVEDPGFRACTGDFEHPICNFAAGLDLDPPAATRLAEIAAERPIFNVYVLPTDRPESRAKLLDAAGFARTYQLVQMIAPPESLPARGNLARCSTPYDRTQVALFMVDQFFARQAAPFREKVADATASATSLELLALRKDGRVLGAAMICMRERMAGLYNLCVESSLRGLGVGASIVREILAVAGGRSLPLTLQCDPKLESWYRDLGFRRAGEVDVYTLPRKERLL